MPKNNLIKIIAVLVFVGVFVAWLAMAQSTSRLPTVGSDANNWGTILNNFLNEEHAADGTHEPSVLKRISGMTNVKEYGAIGDGATDDTAAIQAALNASLNVFLPAGTFKTSAPLPVRSGQAVVGAGSQLTIVLNTTTIGLKRQSSGDIRDVTLRGFRIRAANDSSNSLIAFDLSRFSYSQFVDLAAEFHRTGFKLSREIASGQAYFDTFRDIYALRNQTGILLEDVATGAVPNANTFYNIIIEDVGVWADGNGIDLSGNGNLFVGIYAGIPGGNAAIKIRTVSSKNVFIRPYAESSITYAFDVGAGTSGRKNLVIYPHMDSTSMTLTNAPNDPDLVIFDVTGLNNLAISKSEALLKLTATNPGARTWQLISGGGAEIGTGEFGIQSTDNYNVPFRIANNAPTNAITISNLGDVAIATAGANANAGKLGVGTRSPQSTLSVGSGSGDSAYQYLQIDAESSLPPATDCDSDLERGRLIVDYSGASGAHKLYICTGASDGWDSVTLAN